MNRRNPARAATAARSALPKAALAVQEAPERLLAHMREHQRLLQKIAQKRKAVDALLAKIETIARAMANLQPRIDEARRLEAEIHALFRELLSRKKQPRGTRRAVVDVYNLLHEIGALSPDEASADAGAEDFVNDPEPPWTGAEGPPPSGAGGFSARPAGEGAAGQSVRELFRNLARALHPDTVQDEHEKAKRTEIMKEVSRAYEDGDLARLLHLERTWLAGDAIAPEADEVDRRCDAMARTNDALRAQLADVTEELKELRRSPPVQMLKDLEDSLGRIEDGGLDAFAASVEAEVARLQQLCDFVTSFRDGKMDLDDFAAGPPAAAIEEDEPDEDAFLELLAGLMAEAGATSERKRKRRSKRR